MSKKKRKHRITDYLSGEDQAEERSDEFVNPVVVYIDFDERITPWELANKISKIKSSDIIIRIVRHQALKSEIIVQYLIDVILRSQKEIAIECPETSLAKKFSRAGITTVSQRSRKASSKRNKNSVIRKFYASRSKHDIYVRDQSASKSVPNRYKKKKTLGPAHIAVIGIISAVLVFLFTQVLPRATIVIIPVTELSEETSEIYIEQGLDEQHKSKDRVRGQFHSSSVEVGITKEITEISESGEKAAGEVILQNQTGKEVMLAKDTILVSSNGIEYQISNEVLIPPATIDENNKIQSGTVSVSAHARDPGTKGNRSEGVFTIPELPASKQSRIYAEVAKEFTGGSDKLGKVVRKEDIEETRDELEIKLRQKLEDKILSKRTHDWIYLPELTVITSTLGSIDPPIGDETDEVTVSLVGQAWSAFISREDIYRNFNISDKECGSGKSGTELCNIGVTNLDSFNTDIGEGSLTLLLKRTIIPGYDNEIVVSEILGKSISEARQILLSRNDIKDVRINLKYSLRKFLPRDSRSINVIIEHESIPSR